MAVLATPCVGCRSPVSGPPCVVSPDPVCGTGLPPQQRRHLVEGGRIGHLVDLLVNSKLHLRRERQRVVIPRDIFLQNYHVRGDQYQTRRDGEIQNHVRVFYGQPYDRDGFYGVVLDDGVFHEFVEYVLGLQTFCSLSDDGPASLCLRTQHVVDV